MDITREEVDGVVWVRGVVGVFKALEVLVNDSGCEPSVFAKVGESTLGDAMGDGDDGFWGVVPAKVVGTISVGGDEGGPDVWKGREGC